MRKKCCVCGFMFFKSEGVSAKGLFWCMADWKERQERILESNARLNNEHILKCSSVFCGKENHV